MTTISLRLAALTLGAMAAGACAKKAPEPKMKWEEAVAPVRASNRVFNAAELRSQHLRPAQCEATARDYLMASEDDGWKALRVCVEDENFTLLRELLRPPWRPLLDSKPDAPRVLAKVIANRGGGVHRDVPLLNEQRVALFTFGAALGQPDVHRGQLVLIRAMVTESKMSGGAPTVMLAEYGTQSADFDRQVGLKSYSNSSYEGSRDTSVSATASGSYKTSKYGSGSGRATVSGSARTTSKGSSSNVSGKTETVYDNVSTETGRIALGKLSKANPFLTTDKEFIVLGRFEGTRPSSEADEDPIGIVSVIDFFTPTQLQVY